MNPQIKILIVEDEMLIAANLSLQLSKLGYEVSGIISKGEEALGKIKEDHPDIILLDIRLKGKLDGIETAELIQKEYEIPIIYLTANTNDAYFERAKSTNPQAFISKPFKKLDLQRAIELIANRIMTNPDANKNEHDSTLPGVMEDRIFVKHKDSMVKLFIDDIYYVEADRNYCHIFTRDKTYLLVMTLKEITEKLPAENFLRIHRSYVINLFKIDEVASNHVVVANKTIALSKDSRKELLRRIQTI